MPASQCAYPRSHGLAAVALVGAVLAVAPGAVAQEVSQLTVGHLTGEDRPTIDGHVDEAEWSLTEPYSTFTQQEPNEGQPGHGADRNLVPPRSDEFLHRGHLP